jgi:two-component system sensor histidine kinase/response regulator
LAAGDAATAERLAHTLKGTSGTIGATGIQEISAKVEQAIKNGTPKEELEKMMAQLTEAHTAIITRLKQAFPAQEITLVPSAGDTMFDGAKAGEICSKLASLLSDSDSEAVDFLNEERALFGGVLGAANFQELKRATEAYDFEKALALLREQARTGGISFT